MEDGVFFVLYFFAGMKSFVLVIFVMLLSACGLGQVEVGMHSAEDGIWYGPSYGRHMSGTVYAAGVDYPDGYDWRADMDKGKVKCSLIMFADGIPVLRIPAGDSHEVSTDNSRCRIRNGCLYTDYSDGSTTILKRDGKEFARYEGAEDILCLEVFGGEVHSLSRHEGGTGFVYRVDGEAVLERPDADIYPHLTEYDDSVRFCFSQECRTETGAQLRHYQVASGTVRQVAGLNEASKVWDMKVFGGEVVALASFPGKEPVLVYEDRQEHAWYLGRQDMVSCAFCSTQRLCVSVRCRYSGDGHMSDMLWMGEDTWTVYQFGRTLSAVWADDDVCCAVINPADGRAGAICCGTRSCDMPVGYSVCSRECMVRKEGTVHVGLSSGRDVPPLIWSGGEVHEMDINGPLLCLR